MQMDVPHTRHLQVLMQHQLTRPTFASLVPHVTFWIIGCSQVLDRFPNGDIGRGWVFMLSMHPMLDWFWIHPQDIFAKISCGLWWWLHHSALSAYSNCSSTLGWIGLLFLNNCIVLWKQSWNMVISPWAQCWPRWFCIGYCKCWHCIFDHFYSSLWGRWWAFWGSQWRGLTPRKCSDESSDVQQPRAG